MEKRVPSLDLLRAIAISFVLILHSLEFMSGLSNPTLYLLSYGWIGVDLFFVLSGFLIGSQAFNSNDNEDSPIKKFLTKRFFRTMPLYYFVLLCYLIVKPIAGFPFNDTKLKYFFFLQNFLSPKDFVQSWSLCIEEQFYLLFPLLFFKFRLKQIPSYFWLLPGLLSLVVRFIFYQYGIAADSPSAAAYNYHFVFITHLDGISWGVFLASTFKTWSKFKFKLPILGLGIILLMATLYFIGPLNLNQPMILSFQLLAISFSCILIGLHDLKSYPGAKIIEMLATWSYGIYLWNNLMARLIGKILHSQNDFVKASSFFLGTIAISVASYYLIEKPTLKIRNRLLVKIK